MSRILHARVRPASRHDQRIRSLEAANLELLDMVLALKGDVDRLKAEAEQRRFAAAATVLLAPAVLTKRLPSTRSPWSAR